MSHAVDDSRKLARNLQRAVRPAERLAALQLSGTGTANVRALSDAIAREAELGLQSRGLVE